MITKHYTSSEEVMRLMRLVLVMVSATMMVLGSGVALGQATSTSSGQDYPSKPIRIVTGSPGSNGDFASRLIAPGIAGSLGQQVIVDNRPSGVILGETVAKALPDGHTLLVTGSSLWLAPFLQSNLPWDPVKDFSPITLLVSVPNVLVVHPSLPVRSVKELIALAKARPGEINYASGATGSAPHLVAELFKAMANVNIVRVPYKGTAQALNDLLCAFVYDEAEGMPEEGIPPGTRWQDVPETWSCPDCSVSKSDFEMIELNK